MNSFFVSIGKLKPAARWGGLALAVILIVAGYYFGVLVSHQNEMNQMKNQYNVKRAELNKMAAIVTERGYYLEEIENLNREFKVASAMLPDKKEIPSLLKKISEEAEKFGLDVYFFEPTSEIAKGFYAEVPVSIKLKGSYHEILSFFDAVNKLARIVNISNISMNVTENAKKKNSRRNDKQKNGGAFSAFHLNKTNLDISFKATTFRFLGQAEIKTTNKKKEVKRGKAR